MDVANNIRKTRIHRNYTQDYLAAKLKISQNAYSKIELGRTKVTVEKLLIIADVLNTNACDLINIKAQ
jgi:transcriptional regulator with XRE-family HTH domain